MFRRRNEGHWPCAIDARQSWRWVCVSAVMFIFVWSISIIGAQAGGDLDPTFGNDGRVVVNVGTNVSGGARAMAVQSDGKIVVAVNGGGFFEVRRFEVDGTRDTGFGIDGVTFALFQGNSDPKAVFIEADGKILVAGETIGGTPENPTTSLSRARFDANGVLDATFGEGGKSVSLLGVGQEDPSLSVRFRISVVTALPDGGFALAGTRETAFGQSPGFRSPLVARYVPLGSTDVTLDGGFGDNGIFVTIVGQGPDVGALLFQPDDGKLVLVGNVTVAAGQNVMLLRFTAAGELDPSFGDGGVVLTDVQGADTARAAVLQSTGDILVAGHANGDVALVRYLPDGRRDNSFDGDGKVTTDVNGGTDKATALLVQPDGKLLVAGSTGPAGTDADDFLVVRYNPDGGLDPTFGDSGIVVTDLVGLDEASVIARQDDGKILVAGGADLVGRADLALVRYESGTQADLTIAKVASASAVNVGQTFSYTLTVVNRGPGTATNVLVRDRIPSGLEFVSCTAPGGVCGVDGDTRTISFAAIPVGQTRTATLTVTLSPAVPDGATIENLASVDSDAVDPDATSNMATIAIVARNTPHTVRLFLHGTDVPGTATGFTMNAVAAPARPLALNLRNAPTWFSNPALTGAVGAGGTFRVVRPCTLGLSLAATYRLAKTDLAGGSVEIVGQTQRLLAPCIGQEAVSIPVATPVTFSNQRLRLTISSTVNANLDLQLGEGAFFEITNFAGLP